MKTEKNAFVYYLSSEIKVDLGEIDELTWNKIKKDVQLILAAKQTDDIGMAYVAAFIIYLSELDMLSREFDFEIDLFN